MLIERNKFLELLSTILPGIARKDFVDQFTHFIFDKKRAVTYNEQVCVCMPFRTEFACSVAADEFLKLIKSLRAEELELGMIQNGEKHAMTITADKVEAELAVAGNIEEVEKNVKRLKLTTLATLWKPVPDDFAQALQWCLFSASKDATLGKLTCLHIKKKVVTSSDDLRISQFTMSGSMDADIMIPASTVEELCKFEIQDFCVVDPWAYFKTANGAIFCAHLKSDDTPYPNPKAEFEFEGVEVELPGELKSALESAEIMAAGDFPTDKRVRLTIDKGILTVYAENDALGWIKTKVKMGIKNAPTVSIVVNPIFLQEILGKTSSVKIGEDRALFQTDNFMHLVSLHAGE